MVVAVLQMSFAGGGQIQSMEIQGNFPKDVILGIESFTSYYIGAKLINLRVSSFLCLCPPLIFLPFPNIAPSFRYFPSSSIIFFFRLHLSRLSFSVIFRPPKAIRSSSPFIASSYSTHSTMLSLSI